MSVSASAIPAELSEVGADIYLKAPATVSFVFLYNNYMHRLRYIALLLIYTFSLSPLMVFTLFCFLSYNLKIK